MAPAAHHHPLLRRRRLGRLLRPPTVVERANRNAFDFVLELTPEATGRAVLAPGNSGFVPIGVVGARNVNDQLPLYDAFA